MAYAIKYLFKFESSNGTTREIRVLQDGYTGEVIQRPLGRAPVLKKQQNGPVHGTSLEFYAECNVDREFIEFYTSDPKAYRVDLYAGATLLWRGHITPELYSEPDIAPPYDVRVVATDGVGELKLYDYAALGTVTLRALLSGLLARTGLGTDIYLISSLKAGSRGAGALLDMTINLDYMAGESCYDVLTYLLDTLHATITWWKGAWILTRETNVTFTSGKVRYFNTAGNSALLADSVQTLGSLRANPAWPVGQLSTVIDPAKNRVTVQAPWHVVTCLRNSDMGSDADWIKAKNARYETDGYVLPVNINTGTSETAVISQATSMTGLRVPMSLSVKATGATSEISAQVTGAVLGVLLTYKVGNVTYHLVKGDDGVPVWQQGDDISTYIPLRTRIDFQQQQATWDSSRIEAEELTIDNIPPFLQGTTFPAGTLTVYILGYCAKIYGAYLDVVLPKGYQDILRLDNGARGEGSTVEIAIGRETADNAYYAAFLQGLLLDSGNLITSFSDANFTTGMDYLAFIARDYALSVALPRAKVTGKVFLESSVQIPPLVFTKGLLDYWLETFAWNLYEDELEIEARTLPSASLTVESETILESDGSTVSSFSGSGGSASSPMGGGGSNYFEPNEDLQTLIQLKSNYEYLGARDGLFFTGGDTSTPTPDLYVDTVNNQRVLRSPLPLITGGDQIVIDGTPGGGGGGGGATTLAGLDDTNITNPQAGQMLSWNGTKWVNTNAPTGSITSVSLAAGATNGTLHLVVNGTAQSDVAVTGLGSLAYKSSLAASDIPDLSATYQPKDADLTAIAGLTGTSGFLKKTAANTWALDTNTYLTTSSAASTYVSGVALNGNYLRVTKNGANTDLTIPYATKAQIPNWAIRTAFDPNAVEHAIESNYGESGSTRSNVPSEFLYGSVLTLSARGFDSNLSAQFLWDVRHGTDDSGWLWFRTKDSSSGWRDWAPVYTGLSLTKSVLTDLLESSNGYYVKKSGDTMSGALTVNSSLSATGTVTLGSESSCVLYLNRKNNTNYIWASNTGGYLAFGVADKGVINLANSTLVVNNYGIGVGGGTTANSTAALNVTGNAVVSGSVKIGSATISWNSNGYLHIDKPLVTAGDQIVISGTPGGGGGGGATTLAGLDDVTITSVANGQLLQYNGTKWVNVAASSVGRIYSAGTGISISASNAISLASGVCTAGTYYKTTVDTYGRVTAGYYVDLSAAINGDLGIGSSNPQDADYYIAQYAGGGTTTTSYHRRPHSALYSYINTKLAAAHAGLDKVGTVTKVSTGTGLTGGDITSTGTISINSTYQTYITNGNTAHGWGNHASAGYVKLDPGASEQTLQSSISSFVKGVINLWRSSGDNYTFLGFSNGTTETYLGGIGFKSQSDHNLYRKDGSNYYKIWDENNLTKSVITNLIGSTTYAAYNADGYLPLTGGTIQASSSNARLRLITSDSGSHIQSGTSSGNSGNLYLQGYSAAQGGSLYMNFANYYVYSGSAYQSLYHSGNSNKSDVAWTCSTLTASSLVNTTCLEFRGMGSSVGNGGFIDFHYNNSADDYTSRIIESASGKLLVSGDLGVGATPSFKLDVAGQSAAYGFTTKYDLQTKMSSAGWYTVFTALNTNATSQTVILQIRRNYTNSNNETYTVSVNVAYNGKVSFTQISGCANTQLIDKIRVDYVNSGATTIAIHYTGTVANTVFISGIGDGTFCAPTAVSSVNGTAVEFTLQTSGISTNAGVTLANDNALGAYDTGGTRRTLLSLDGSNGIYLAWGAAGAGYNSYISGNNISFCYGTGHSVGMYLNSSGNVGIGTTTPSQKLHVAGSILSTGDQVVSSDLTLKENLTPVTYSVSDIAKARAVEFDWKDGRGHSMGSIAQDWLGIAPALVHGKEGNMSLAYGQLALVNTILLARQSESHEERIKELEARVAELEAEVKRLRMN